MTDTVPVSRELLRQVIGAMIGVFNGEPITGMPIVKSVSALRAALDSTCQDSRQVPAAADKSSIAAEWVRCAAHGAQHDVREIIADMQAAPVQEPVYAFRRKGMDDFCTCNKARFDELASKPHLFETAIFYTSQHKVRGRTEREMVLHITELLASAPQPAQQLAPVQGQQKTGKEYIDSLIDSLLLPMGAMLASDVAELHNQCAQMLLLCSKAQPRKAAVKLSENELLLVLKDAYESSSSQQVEAFLHGARLVEAAVFAKNGWTE